MWIIKTIFALFALFHGGAEDASEASIADAPPVTEAAPAASESTHPVRVASAKPKQPTPKPPAPAPAIPEPEPADNETVALADATGTAGQIVDKVQDFYKGTQHLKAKFRQTVINATFGRKTISDGRVYLAKPGKMRWDYYRKNPRTGSSAVQKSFISDGNDLWAVFVNNKEYYKKSLEDDVLPVAVTFLTGQGDLRRDFNAKLDKSGKWGTRKDHVLELTPKKPSAQYKKLWLVVDPANYRVKQSVVLNSNGDTNQFRFYEPRTGALSSGIFVFNAKANKQYRLVKPPK